MAHQIPMHVAPAAAPLAQVNPLAAYGGGIMQAVQHPPADGGAGARGSKRWPRAAKCWATTALPVWLGLHRPGRRPAGPRPGGAQPAVARAVVQGGAELERRAHHLSRSRSGVFIWWREGAQPALEYYTGYLIELSLSVDNLFVFILIFQYFDVPAEAAAQGAQMGHPRARS